MVTFNIFIQTAPDEPTPTGNARFEGFCVDLLEQIANQVTPQAYFQN